MERRELEGAVARPIEPLRAVQFKYLKTREYVQPVSQSQRYYQKPALRVTLNAQQGILKADFTFADALTAANCPEAGGVIPISDGASSRCVAYVLVHFRALRAEV